MKSARFKLTTIISAVSVSLSLLASGNLSGVALTIRNTQTRADR